MLGGRPEEEIGELEGEGETRLAFTGETEEFLATSCNKKGEQGIQKQCLSKESTTSNLERKKNKRFS